MVVVEDTRTSLAANAGAISGTGAARQIRTDAVPQSSAKATRMALPRKLVLALVAMALLVAAWVSVSRSRPQPATGAARDHVTVPVVREAAPAATRTRDEAELRAARARWEQRRAEIHTARTRRSPEPAPQPPPAPDTDVRDDSPAAAEHGGDAVFAAFNEETTTLVRGCEELIEGKPTPVRVTARLIGAPEVGTMVESVAVSGPLEHPDALTECLMEGMYTLGFGDAATHFERDAVLTLGLLDEVAAQGWLTLEQTEAARQQMIAGGLDPAIAPLVVASEQEVPQAVE